MCTEILLWPVKFSFLLLCLFVYWYFNNIIIIIIILLWEETALLRTQSKTHSFSYTKISVVSWYISILLNFTSVLFDYWTLMLIHKERVTIVSIEGCCVFLYTLKFQDQRLSFTHSHLTLSGCLITGQQTQSIVDKLGQHGQSWKRDFNSDTVTRTHLHSCIYKWHCMFCFLNTSGIYS